MFLEFVCVSVHHNRFLSFYERVFQRGFLYKRALPATPFVKNFCFFDKIILEKNITHFVIFSECEYVFLFLSHRLRQIRIILTAACIMLSYWLYLCLCVLFISSYVKIIVHYIHTIVKVKFQWQWRCKDISIGMSPVCISSKQFTSLISTLYIFVLTWVVIGIMIIYWIEFLLVDIYPQYS